MAPARSIRGEVALGPLADRLGELLARAGAGDPVADEVLELLTAEPSLRAELGRRVPREQDTDRTAYEDLPGHHPADTLAQRA